MKELATLNAKLDTTNKETYIFGNFNINLCHNDTYIIRKNNALVSRSLSNDARNYHQFCTLKNLRTNNKISDSFNL